MKKIFALFTGVLFLLAVGTASALEARGWRITVVDSIANNTPVVISEVEWLYDTGGSVYADGTESDLGIVACGWTREAPNLTGSLATIPVGCDSVSTNQLPDDSMTVPANTRRTRLGKIAFDDVFTSYFITKRNITATNLFHLEYSWYVGPAAPSRTLPDVVAYTVTVPNEFINPLGDTPYAPSNWTVEYRDVNTGRWVRLENASVFAANFNDGVSVNGSGTEVSDTDVTAIGKRLFFLLQ